MAHADLTRWRRPLLAALVGVLPGMLAAQQPVPTVTLAQAIEMALRVQPTVIQAVGAVRSADMRRQVATAAWFPSLTLTSTGTNSFQEGAARLDPTSGQLVTGARPINSVSSSVQAQLELFDGFRRAADNQAAKAGQQAATMSLTNAQFQQALQTTNQFFDALSAQQLLIVRQASVRRAEEQLNTSIARLQVGAAARSDTLRSAVTLGNARLQLLTAETQLATAEANLARLIGAAARVRATDDSAFYQPIVIDTTTLRAEARDRSPQVLSAEANYRAARATLKSSRSTYWPTLTLTANAGFNASQTTKYNVFKQRTFSLNLNWPLFNRFQREQTITTQEVAYDNAEAAAAEARRLIDANLTTRLAELDAARLRIQITQTSVVAATEDLRVQQERYRLGAATIVDVLTSQEALNQAEVDAVNARFDYLRAKAQIEALIGRSL